MKMTLTRTIDGAPWEDLGTFEGSTAHDDQFLNPDPRCRLQLRRLFTSDLPSGLPLGGATALLWVKGRRKEPPTKYSVRMPPELVANTRAGVLHAIACVALHDPALSAGLVCMAQTQVIWGMPEAAESGPATPEASSPSTVAARPAEAIRPKRTRRSQRRNRR